MRHVWQGWLVSNGGLQIPKFLDQVAWLEETFRQRHMTLRPVLNHQLSAAVVDNRPAVVFEGACLDAQSHGLPDFVLFWDKDVRLARMLERMGLRLFNTAESIAVCDDKSATHLALSGMGIPLPDTVVAPMNFPGRMPIQDDFVVHAEAVLGYPMVVKESFGSFGDQVYLASNREELLTLHARLEATPHLAQRYIRTSHGRDVRLQVVGGRVVAAMLRQSATDFRANVSAGGHMSPFSPPASFVDLAVRAARAVGADFAGVDLLFGAGEQPMVCEVNSNAHMRNIEQCTGVDVPAAIADHIAHCLEAERAGNVK